MALEIDGRLTGSDSWLRHFAARTLGADRERWLLWFPVGVGIGVAGYFSLPFEPGMAPGISLLVLAMAVGLMGWVRLRQGRAGTGLVIAALALAAPALGFSAAKFQNASITAPVIAKKMGPAMVEGRISTIEPGLKGPRVTIDNPVISRLAAKDTPGRVRVRIRPSLVQKMKGKMTLGAQIRVLAILLPPPGPAVPGGFDFARSAWFKGIGDVGFVVRAPEIIKPDSSAEGGVKQGLGGAIHGHHRTNPARPFQPYHKSPAGRDRRDRGGADDR